ncbi:hypothetical protein [Entomobacter blattae]|uniref:Lipoprotein n=1 Tax=Entomobacter blattae TaxID=2762277 RepID=A0A7H1NQ91_9PROT|nr:hypothetical protein [Entomobacter blattae]QNT77951.1 hypothetical protein JGUZn3_07100 [Entomobacter blattae]
MKKETKGLVTALSMASMVFLAGCVDIPRPFRHPDEATQKLSSPPPSRLVIVPATQTLLDNKGSELWRQDMVKALVSQTVPVVAREASEGDWLLAVSASITGNQVTPLYVITDPGGKERARKQGEPVAANLWSSGDPVFLDAVAQQGAVVVSGMLTGIQAQTMAQDPKSLKNRAAKVYFVGVKGAPGDGNISIARQFYKSFPDKMNIIQTTPKEADFTVSCQVSVTAGAKGTTGHPLDNVEIVWTVLNKEGKEAGKVSQLNAVAAHSLDKFWDSVATVVAEEAAGGIKQVITNNSGRNNRPLPEPNAHSPSYPSIGEEEKDRGPNDIQANSSAKNQE